MRAPCDSIGVLCNSIHDRVQHGVDDAVGERFWIILAVEERAVGLGSRNARRVAHVVLERIVDVEVDVVHRGDGDGAQRNVGSQGAALFQL